MIISDISLHLGATAGNLLHHQLKDLELPVDFLISGPPCPPWAGQGCRRSVQDGRAHVFIPVLSWVFYLVKVGCLLGCLLENVVGITHMVEGRESTMDVFLMCLRHWCPEFDWCVQTLDASDYKLAQTRVRVFLSGFRILTAMS